jgi:hypothetical protein
MLPPTITDGTADMTPVIKRPTYTAPTEGTNAITMQKTQYIAADTIYTGLRPNVSEYGGNTTPPVA